MHDREIRQLLRAEMSLRHSGDPQTLVLDELGLCQGIARVDLVVVNGSLHGYEIKSDCDTLTRLAGQRAVYNRTLDYVTIVVGKNHLKGARRAVPSWWGIWTVVSGSQSGSLKEIRPARPNPSVEPVALAQLLWRDEALAELEQRGLADGLRAKPRFQLWRELAERLPVEELGAVVRQRLRMRSRWRVRSRRRLGGVMFPPSAT